MRKKYLLFVFLSAFIAYANAQGPCTPLLYNDSLSQIAHPEMYELNLVTDFCAHPDDNLNDSLAFKYAADFISKRGGSCHLVIPAGTYIVGHQPQMPINNSGTMMIYGTIVFQLIGTNSHYVNNVIIEGDSNGATRLKYDVGFKVGTFMEGGTVSTNKTFDCATTVSYTNDTAIAHINDCFQLVYCRNVTLKNLTLDGNFRPETLNNMNNFPVGGCGTQNAVFDPGKINIGGGANHGCGPGSWHTGVLISKCGNVTLDHITTCNFGLDGFAIKNYDTSALQKNIVLKDCVADSNARTGLAITGGDSIHILNCAFQNTAQGYGLSTGSGVDIEGENIIIKNTFFKNCIFYRNHGNAGALAYYGAGSHDVYFDSCIFVGIPNGNALYIGGNVINSYTFTNSTFYGHVQLQMNSASSVAEGLKFLHCTFTDCYKKYDNATGNYDPVPCISSPSYMFQGTQQYLTVDDCKFKAVQNNFVFSIHGSGTSVVRNSFIGTGPIALAWAPHISGFLYDANLTDNVFVHKAGDSLQLNNVTQGNNFDAVWVTMPTCDTSIYEDAYYAAKYQKQFGAADKRWLNIYPTVSPDGMFTIASQILLPQSEIFIRNIMGQEMLHERMDIHPGENRLDTHIGRSGMYLVTIVNSGLKVNFKIIVRK